MKIFLLLFLLTPLFYFSQSDIKGWNLAATASNGVKSYVKNIKKDYSGDHTCWVKTVMPEEKYKNKKGITVTKQSRYYMEYWKIYCDEMQYSVSEVTEYNNKGIPVQTHENDTQIKNAIPDSVAEGIILFVCDMTNKAANQEED